MREPKRIRAIIRGSSSGLNSTHQRHVSGAMGNNNITFFMDLMRPIVSSKTKRVCVTSRSHGSGLSPVSFFVFLFLFSMNNIIMRQINMIIQLPNSVQTQSESQLQKKCFGWTCPSVCIPPCRFLYVTRLAGPIHRIKIKVPNR